MRTPIRADRAGPCLCARSSWRGTNPGYLFVGALLPQFIVPSQPQVLQYVVIGLVFCAIDFSIMFAYALLGSQAMRMLRARGAVWIDRVCGAVLIGLAGWLAFARRAGAG